MTPVGWRPAPPLEPAGIRRYDRSGKSIQWQTFGA